MASAVIGPLPNDSNNSRGIAGRSASLDFGVRGIHAPWTYVMP